MVRSIALATIVLSACGADFIEPNPPRLIRARVDYAASSFAEPAVWLVVSDLFLEHDEDCAAAVSWLRDAVRAAIPASAAGTLELPPIQTSPCTQPNARTIDASAIDLALRAAEDAFPGRAVRGVVVYANNVLLTVPGQIAFALDSVRKLAVARGGLQPRLWAILPARMTNTVIADRALTWSYAFDPAIERDIARIAAGELPFTTDTAVVTPPMPLFGSGPAGVRVFKVCGADPGVQPLGFAADGTPVAIDAGNPPQYRVALSARLALPRSDFQPLHAAIEVEACTDHCDRYYGDDPVRWLTRPGCFLAGGAP